MCAGRHALMWFFHGIRARLDGREEVLAVVVRDGAAGPGEVRVEGRGVLVALVDVASGGVRLPDLHELVRDRAAPRVEQTAGHRDALALRLAAVLERQIGLDGRDIPLPVGGREQLDGLGIHQPRILRGVSEQARSVRREVVEGRRNPLTRGFAPRVAACTSRDLAAGCATRQRCRARRRSASTTGRSAVGARSSVMVSPSTSISIRG